MDARRMQGGCKADARRMQGGCKADARRILPVGIKNYTGINIFIMINN